MRYILTNILKFSFSRLGNILSRDQKLLANLLAKTSAVPNFLQGSNLVHEYDCDVRKYRTR